MAKNGQATEVAVVKAGAMVAFDPTKFETGTKNMAQAAASRAGFLKMDKTGDWTYGANDTHVDEDDLVYIDPMGSVHGWQCWADTDIDGVQAELLGTVKAPHYEPMPPRPDEVPNNGREWAEMYGISALLNGQRLVYTTTSLGGKDAMANLAQAMLAQFKTDRTKMVPVVHLRSDWYKHKKWGKLYVPVFEVVKFVAAPPKEALEPQAEAPAAPPPKRSGGKPAPMPPAKKTPAKPARRAA